MEQLNPKAATASGSAQSSNSNSNRSQDFNSLTSATNTDLSYTDGYSFKEDPRYKNLCINRRRTFTYQSFAPFKDEQDRVYQQLSQLLEYDFQRRTPLFRKSSSVEDFSKAFSTSMCGFKHSLWPKIPVPSLNKLLKIDSCAECQKPSRNPANSKRQS
jgi:hypothetical protein